MQTQTAIESRHSARDFSNRSIPPDLIEKIVDAARLAPTARNTQPWEFVVITEKTTLLNLGNLTADNGKFISASPCCIAVFCKDSKYYLEDGCAATENILIAATDLGLASCWVAGDKKPYCDKVKELLKVPLEFKLVSLVALGYSGKTIQMPSKRPLKEVLHWQRF